MKIRNGFVSNSSSTSFTVAFKPPVKCPHCGRSNVSVLDLIERSRDDETYIIWNDPTNYIEELQEEIYENQLDLEKWKNMSDDETVSYNYGYNQHSYTVQQLRKWANGTIDTNTKEINTIREAQEKYGNVVCFSVSYHDVLNQIVHDEINNGSLILVCETDE